MIRTILSIAATVLLIAGSGVLVGFSAEREANARFAGLAVDVQEIDGMFFVDAAGVTDQILANDSIEGTFVSDLSLQEVERWVREIPAVDEVLVYPGLDRTLRVHVTQRKPLARLHTASDAADVYIDSDGLELPLSPYYTARVPVIHATSFEAALEGFALVEATHQDPLWSAFIDQIEVNPDGSLDVVPRIGGARIHVGNMARLDEKLNKLLVFYTEQIERGNLNIYKRIDLTYEDQVVAQRYY